MSNRLRQMEDLVKRIHTSSSTTATDGHSNHMTFGALADRTLTTRVGGHPQEGGSQPSGDKIAIPTPPADTELDIYSSSTFWQTLCEQVSPVFSS